MAKRHRLDRLLWGVVFNSRTDPTRGSMLLGEGWDNARAKRASQEWPVTPSRTLLFQSRTQARAWCTERRQFYRTYPNGHICRGWQFAPVRVRELTEVVSLAQRRASKP